MSYLLEAALAVRRLIEGRHFKPLTRISEGSQVQVHDTQQLAKKKNNYK